MIRLIEYNTKLMQQHMTQHRTTKLLTILNFVLYSGHKNYQGPESIAEAFDDPEQYMASLKQKIVIKLAQETDDRILKDQKAALAEFVLVHSHYRDFYNLLDEKKFIIDLIYKSTYVDAAVVYMLTHETHEPE